jgi:hypothetical protein
LYSLLNKQNDLKKIIEVKELLEVQFSDSINKNNTYKVSSFQELCDLIWPLFKDNEKIFSMFGPNSGEEAKEQLRWDLTLWYKIRKEKLIPNNKQISNLILDHKFLIPQTANQSFEKLLAHIYAFEKHCEDANFDYSQYQFPKEMHLIVDDARSK